MGLLYAAPGGGALLGALSSGWVGRIRRQGLAVIVSVIIWGVAITGFGLVTWLPVALVLLAVAGWADVVSAVFRNTIIQFSGPESMRGRLMGVQIAVVTGGPRLGDLESGAVATAFGETFAIVSGGLACIFGAVVVARLLPGFWHQRSDLPHAPAGGALGGAVGADGALGSAVGADGATGADGAFGDIGADRAFSADGVTGVVGAAGADGVAGADAVCCEAEGVSKADDAAEAAEQV